MKLGKYFTLEEMTRSQTAARRGLPNQPTAKQLESLKALVRNVLDPLREALGRPVNISSGFRSEAVNKAVGGSSSSQHRYGEAADIVVPGLTVEQVVARIRSLNLPFDQLIDEFGSWVHVSHGPRHRRQVLRARRDFNGRTIYTKID